MIVFVDECLPISDFRPFLEARGHRVYGVGEAFPSGAPDQAIRAAADDAGAVVFSVDADWATLVQQIPAGHKATFKRIGRVLFKGDHATAFDRLAELIEDIEREHETAVRRGIQLIMRITKGNFRVER